MMGKTSGKPCPPPLSLFFDLIACPWDMIGHDTSHTRSIFYACEVPHAIQRPGKSYHTAQLTIPPFHFLPLYCRPSPGTCSSSYIFLPPLPLMLSLGCLWTLHYPMITPSRSHFAFLTSGTTVLPPHTSMCLASMYIHYLPE